MSLSPSAGSGPQPGRPAELPGDGGAAADLGAEALGEPAAAALLRGRCDAGWKVEGGVGTVC